MKHGQYYIMKYQTLKALQFSRPLVAGNDPLQELTERSDTAGQNIIAAKVRRFTGPTLGIYQN